MKKAGGPGMVRKLTQTAHFHPNTTFKSKPDI